MTLCFASIMLLYFSLAKMYYMFMFDQFKSEFIVNDNRRYVKQVNKQGKEDFLYIPEKTHSKESGNISKTADNFFMQNKIQPLDTSNDKDNPESLSNQAYLNTNNRLMYN